MTSLPSNTGGSVLISPQHGSINSNNPSSLGISPIGSPQLTNSNHNIGSQSSPAYYSPNGSMSPSSSNGGGNSGNSINSSHHHIFNSSSNNNNNNNNTSTTSSNNIDDKRKSDTFNSDSIKLKNRSQSSEDLKSIDDKKKKLFITPKLVVPKKGGSTGDEPPISKTLEGRMKSIPYIKKFKLPTTEILLHDYSAALFRQILLHGRIYLFTNHICFESKIFGIKTSEVIPIKDISQIKKKSRFTVGIEIITNNNVKYSFASFVSRDKTYKDLLEVWKDVTGETHEDASSLSIDDDIDDEISNSEMMDSLNISSQQVYNQNNGSFENNNNQIVNNNNVQQGNGNDIQQQQSIDDASNDNNNINNNNNNNSNIKLVNSQTNISTTVSTSDSTNEQQVVTSTSTSSSSTSISTVQVDQNVNNNNGNNNNNNNNIGNGDSASTSSIATTADTANNNKPQPQPQQSQTNNIQPVQLIQPPQLSQPQQTPPQQHQPPQQPQQPQQQQQHQPQPQQQQQQQAVQQPIKEVEKSPLDEIYGSVDQYLSKKDQQPQSILESPSADFQELLSDNFNVSVVNFFRALYSDKCNFVHNYHVKRGDMNVNVKPWTFRDRFGTIRELEYVAPVSSPIGPDKTRIQETQRYHLTKTKLIVETDTIMLDIPYGDHFRIEAKWEINETSPDTCRLSISLCVRFIKKTWFKSKIETTTVKETKTSFDKWTQLAKLEIQKMLQVKPKPQQLPQQPQQAAGQPTIVIPSLSRSIDKTDLIRLKDEERLDSPKPHHTRSRSRQHLISSSNQVNSSSPSANPLLSTILANSANSNASSPMMSNSPQPQSQQHQPIHQSNSNSSADLTSSHNNDMLSPSSSTTSLKPPKPQKSSFSSSPSASTSSQINNDNECFIKFKSPFGVISFGSNQFSVLIISSVLFILYAVMFMKILTLSSKIETMESIFKDLVNKNIQQ